MTKFKRGLAEESKASPKEVVVAQLVERMAELGKTRSEVARGAGMQPVHLRRFLNTEDREIELGLLGRVAEALDLEIRLVPKARK